MRFPPHQNRRQGGFMLLEMLVVIALLAAFALVAARLFTWSMRVLREAPEAETQILRFDAMLDALRRDVWSAEQIDLTDEKAVQVMIQQQPTIRWQIIDGKIIRSVESDSTKREWPRIGPRVGFEPYDNGLILLIRDTRSQPSDRIILPSQLKLLPGDAK